MTCEWHAKTDAIPASSHDRGAAAFRDRDAEIGIIAVSGGGSLDLNLFLRAAVILDADVIFTVPFANAELLAKVAELLETTNGLDDKKKATSDRELTLYLPISALSCWIESSARPLCGERCGRDPV